MVIFQKNICYLQNLIFTVPPISVTLGKPEPVRAGELLQLACTAKDSNPKTTLTWYSQDNPIPDGAGKFFEIHFPY